MIKVCVKADTQKHGWREVRRDREKKGKKERRGRVLSNIGERCSSKAVKGRRGVGWGGGNRGEAQCMSMRKKQDERARMDR